MTLTVASMFSGIGLIDLGLERAGMKTRVLCENDKAASTVLARRFPGIPIHPDIRELTADDLYAAGCRPDATVTAAGFPCQDLSIAGGRRGMGEGTRSGLFWHVDRLLAEFAPRWVLLENVPGLLSSHGGRDMGAVLGALADRGYGYAYRVLDAQRFGVPQRRERVVIVGHLGEPWTAPAQVLLEPDCCGWDFATLRESGSRATGGAGAGSGIPRVTVNALTSSHGVADDNDAQAGHLVVCVTGDRTHALTANGADASEDGTGRGTPIVYQRVIRSGARLPDAIELVAADTEVRRLTPLECERLQGAPDEWTEGQADSPRYKQLGNSVAVPVFEWVGRRIVAVDAQIRAERAA